jgi:O-antigen ligase
MSVTAILWAVLYSAAVIFSVVNPLFGSLGYLLEYYMRPELKWWGDELPGLRYNLMISVTLGAAFLLRRSSLRTMQEVSNPALRWLLALLAVMLIVTSTVALNTEVSLDWTIQWVKMAVIFPLLVVGVVRTRNAFNLFIVAHILGAFWWGWECWLDPTREASRLLNVGSGDTLNDNGAAAHLLTVLPLCVVFLLTEKEKWVRAVALIAAPFVVNTIILCNSRGATVGMAVALASSFFLIRSGYRLRVIGAAVAMVLAVLLLADEQFITRQQTTTNYEEDGSARQRLITWRGGLQLMIDRPWGTGGRGFHLLSPIYIPEVVESHGGDLRAPHNTYVMVATEWGVLGLVCFIGVYASAFMMLRRVKQRARPEDEGFYYWRAFAIQLALIAFLVAASFTDRLYGEAGYWMVALSFVLYRMQLTDYAEAAQTATVTAAPEGHAIAPTWPLAHAR